MRILNQPLTEFIDELGSKAPVPGGGSAAALTGAIGIALGTMVGELTIGKKKYAEYEAQLSNLIFRSRELIEQFEESIIRDIEAFKPLSDVYKMPSSTEEEKEKKRAAMQEALIPAVEAPMELAELCVKALRILDSLSLIGTKMAISDAGSGATICEAALKSARLNALINIRSLEDEGLKKSYLDRLDAVTDTGLHLAEITYQRVENEIR